jgi:hypothetical protein
MRNRAIVVILAIGAIVISALAVIALVNPTPRLVELKGCAGSQEVFVNPEEVAALIAANYHVAVVLRGNAEPVPTCETASGAAEKLGRVRRLED